MQEQTATVTTEPATANAPQTVTVTTQSGQKKQYINDIGDPSKVVHCRNVTADVTQSGLVAMCQQFGRVVNVVMLRAKNQALIEMDNFENAKAVVEYCQQQGFVDVDHRRVYVKYSRHQELSDTPAGKTLLVSMFNPEYDISGMVQITPLIVYQIFGNYGQVEKIVVLPKNSSSAQNHNRVQSLVQFSDKEGAERVKNILQGQPVNLGDQASFFLDIQFSKVPEITATGNTATSMVVPKGFTPQLLAQQQMFTQMGQMGQMGQMNQVPVGQMGQINPMGQMGQMPMGQMGPMGASPQLLAPQFNPFAMQGMAGFAQ